MKRVVVTGAFSYTGAAVAKELLDRGYAVHTLTNRRAPFASHGITSAPLVFDVSGLTKELEGAAAFINTFWIRLPHRGQTFATAVECSRSIIEAAKRTSTRLVHVSVSNAASGRNLGYYAGKADLEDAVRADLLSYAIVRPTLVVGPNDVLSNNIAWFLRRFPLFPLPSGGQYRLRPVTLADTARIIVDAMEASENLEVDAAGPEVMTFAEFVQLLGAACGREPRLVSVPDWVALGALKLLEPLFGDVILTREELMGLKQELLTSSEAPLGTQSVRSWLLVHGQDFGRRYTNDMKRHFGDGKSEPVLDPYGL